MVLAGALAFIACKNDSASEMCSHVPATTCDGCCKHRSAERGEMKVTRLASVCECFGSK